MHPITTFTFGSGQVRQADDGVTLSIRDCPPNGYADAQIYDYAGRKRANYPCKPPIRLSVRAYASHPVEAMRGTLGFGFWNQPFMPGQVWPRLPRYAWFFFGGPPHNMTFALNAPGHGWKSATADFNSLGFKLLAPLAPLGFLLMHSQRLYNALWPLAQRAIRAAEQTLAVDLTNPREYSLDWLPNRVIWRIDGQQVFEAPYSPRPPLGFIAWIDNQYAIITPQGNLSFGVVEVTGEQWLKLESLQLVEL